ncbi:MAG: hypothetical protein LLF98_11605 [Clostridium sp.]|uniref:hypothetical protein n=1 Tax=Clostridium sp. TaxID=1506 RepID=UPI0025BD186C|nr:hypothetical protein [Clostridium sp.]MCE5221874.1 hypothetical protein [Clostridium sp.]
MEEIKRIPTTLEIKEFLITFEYETWKGKHRKINKRSIKHFDQQEAKRAFKDWSKLVRTMSNVQILDIAEIEENKQEIVL